MPKSMGYTQDSPKRKVDNTESLYHKKKDLKLII